MIVAATAPTVDDFAVFGALCAALLVVLAVGKVLDLIGRWLDGRRWPAPLTVDQLAARGVRHWEDLHRHDAEGEVVA